MLRIDLFSFYKNFINFEMVFLGICMRKVGRFNCLVLKTLELRLNLWCNLHQEIEQDFEGIKEDVLHEKCYLICLLSSFEVPWQLSKWMIEKCLEKLDYVIELTKSMIAYVALHCTLHVDRVIKESFGIFCIGSYRTTREVNCAQEREQWMIICFERWVKHTHI